MRLINEMNGIYTENKPVNQWGDFRPGVVGSVGDSKRRLLTRVSSYWGEIETFRSRYASSMGTMEHA